MKTENNIFNFATKELSQDAVICWCINWINHPDSELYELALGLLKKINLDPDNIVDHFKRDGRNDTEKERVIILQQYKNIDVLLIIPDINRAIIIEDKTFTSEHDDQIAVYRKRVEDSAKELNLEDPDIVTVYLKTGYFTDDDRLMKDNNKANVIVKGPEFLQVLKEYEDRSEILKSYVEYLENLTNSFNEYGDFTKKDKNGIWYLERQSIAQYRLMRTIFPEEKWNKESDVYKIKPGTSVSGKPWTVTEITKNLYFKGSTTDDYSLFWRIHSDSDGPYLSLRRKDDYDKENEADENRHIETYKKMLEILKKIMEKPEIDLDWEKDGLYDGYRGGYKESSLLRIVLGRFLENWDSKGDQLVEDVRKITDYFLEEVKNSDI